MKEYFLFIAFLFLADFGFAQVENAKFNDENLIDLDNAKVLESLVVVNRSGAEIRTKPDINSKVQGKYEFGDRVEILDYEGDWAVLKERVQRETEDEHSTYIRWAWEKVYIKKDNLGKVENIRIVPEDLKVIAGWDENNNQINVQDNLFDIELITEIFFNSKKNTVVDYMIYDTLAVKKKKGVISLKCDNGKIVKFEDRPDAGDGTHEFYYVGQIPFLNKYVLKGSYWEWVDCILVDKKSGEQININYEVFITPDKKHIISFFVNPYKQTTDMMLHSISGNKTLKEEKVFSFLNWMPFIDSKEDGFCSSDGYLYLKVMHSKSYWREDGNFNDKYQYIRMKVR